MIVIQNNPIQLNWFEKRFADLTTFLIDSKKQAMKKLFFIPFSIIILISILLSGCQAVGDIFKAGMWSGILIVVLIVGVILFAISKLGKKE